MACSNDAFDLIAIVMTLMLIHLGLTLPLFNCMKFESVAESARIHRPFLESACIDRSCIPGMMV